MVKRQLPGTSLSDCFYNQTGAIGQILTLPPPLNDATGSGSLTDGLEVFDVYVWRHKKPTEVTRVCRLRAVHQGIDRSSP